MLTEVLLAVLVSMLPVLAAAADGQRLSVYLDRAFGAADGYF
ncbi:MAG: hypothetical protein AAFX58_10665 [Pseudomonadota bacterium]